MAVNSNIRGWTAQQTRFGEWQVVEVTEDGNLKTIAHVPAAGTGPEAGLDAERTAWIMAESSELYYLLCQCQAFAQVTEGANVWPLVEAMVAEALTRLQAHLPT